MSWVPSFSWQECLVGQFFFGSVNARENETQKLLGAEIFFLYLQARCFFMQGEYLPQVRVYEGF